AATDVREDRARKMQGNKEGSDNNNEGYDKGGRRLCGLLAVNGGVKQRRMQGRKLAVATSGRGAAMLLGKSSGRDGGLRQGKNKGSNIGMIGNSGCFRSTAMAEGRRRAAVLASRLWLQVTDGRQGLAAKEEAGAGGSNEGCGRLMGWEAIGSKGEGEGGVARCDCRGVIARLHHCVKG
ncbi:hypothetical protein BHM03_00058000, partial [Ensete ventricosum]